MELVWFIWKASWAIFLARDIWFLMDANSRHESLFYMLYQRDFGLFVFATIFVLGTGPVMPIVYLWSDIKEKTGIRLLKPKAAAQAAEINAVPAGHWLE